MKEKMKTLKEFVALFAEQFDETDASEITASTAFHDLDEWSSLIGLSVIAMVDEEFDVALKGDDVKSSITIEDLYKHVIAKV
jgi:acyl carrier protein